jgi:hypothetical protein
VKYKNESLVRFIKFRRINYFFRALRFYFVLLREPYFPSKGAKNPQSFEIYSGFNTGVYSQDNFIKKTKCHPKAAFYNI